MDTFVKFLVFEPCCGKTRKIPLKLVAEITYAMVFPLYIYLL